MLKHFELEKAILAYCRVRRRQVGNGEAISSEIGDGRLRCVAISDTHMLHWKIELPPGDVLIHCGDFTNNGTEEECRDFCDWAKSLSFPHKLLVCGNHDLPCDESWYREHWKEWRSERQSSSEIYRMLQAAGFEVLHGTSCSIAGVKFYGSPIQPAQPSSRTEMAFGRMRGGQELKEEWKKIPKDVDVLITHTPPHQIMDETQYAGKRKKHTHRLRNLAPSAVWEARPSSACLWTCASRLWFASRAQNALHQLRQCH